MNGPEFRFTFDFFTVWYYALDKIIHFHFTFKLIEWKRWPMGTFVQRKRYVCSTNFGSCWTLGIFHWLWIRKCNLSTPSRLQWQTFLIQNGFSLVFKSYPHTSGVGYGYSPMKIDLGGVVLGAIIGIGALLIIPKVVGTLNGGYGTGYGYSGNYRSVDGGDPTGISEMLAKLDDILGKDNIDSTNCMQRAVCTYVRQSTYHHKMGTADQTDQIINTLSEWVNFYCKQIVFAMNGL